MRTLLLDTVLWDLVKDAAGNIAVADEPYALAQDVASACRLFQGECWFDTSKGIPFFAQILGHLPPPAVVKAAFVRAAQTVPDVANAQCFLRALDKRALTGQVQFPAPTGGTQVVTVSQPTS